MNRHLRLAARLLGACLLVLALCAGWAGWLQGTGNFHAVIPGELYRSAQPTGRMLDRWVAETGIRSVVNLRGASDSDWYRDEIAQSDRLSLVHADFAMRDDRMLPPERAAALVDLIASLPKPVLIHCKAGADRTGLAAALYLARHGETEARAEAQLSFRFGHVGLPVSAAWAMDQSWEEMEPALGFES